MSKAPRYYVALAFLPIGLAAAALLFLHYYQQGESERRDSWQQPQAVLDALGIIPGMRVAEWKPSDTYFLQKMSDRVGPPGKVYAIRADPGVHDKLHETRSGVEEVEPAPSGLDAALFVLIEASDQNVDDLQGMLRECFNHLRPGGRVGIIGLESTRVQGSIKEGEAKEVASNLGFKILREVRSLLPQFFLVLEKPGT